MMVLFVSQCEKNALPKTRRVLDSFASRIGDNTWKTVITEEGLSAVRKLLKKTASKSTAVSCHWLRSRSRSDLLWVVGNKTKFDEQGIVPVNSTEKELDHFINESNWSNIDTIHYAATIAGLFHDFGKANNLFQRKINPNYKSEESEPYRHEWVSIRLFQSFVNNKKDHEWLRSLSQINREMFVSCYKDGIDGDCSVNNPLLSLPPFAQLVSWLILTHHKLPSYPHIESTSPDLKNIDNWLKNNFEANWNSPKCKTQEKHKLLQDNWCFKNGLPVESVQWRSKACLLASEAIAKLQIKEENYLNNQIFTSHIARMCLMLGDHYYSAQEKVTEEWRNENYEVYANTDRKNNSLKQKLDEHLIGVAYHAGEISKKLPKLIYDLRNLGNNTILESDVEKKINDVYGWQDKAKKLALGLSKDTIENGFFGINMASTGTGKTQANAKIMYAIGKKNNRARFSVALGLRSLTLQTGNEFQEKLKIDEDDIAIVVGGQTLNQLFENNSDNNRLVENLSELEELTGSESCKPIFDDNIQITYRGDLQKHSLSQWTMHDSKIEKLIQAPVLVCTIDHLIPATEGTRGGKQIAPMLRLLTSDLILDEPDDFNLEDLPALCRLVHWAGMLGSRVLLSSATIPPALAYALFESYQTGWRCYAKENIKSWGGHIACAWFDEYECTFKMCENFNSYKINYDTFTNGRAKNITTFIPHKKKGYIAYIDKIENNPISNLSKIIHQNILKLHQEHKISKNNKNISIGLVRMANINPLIAVAKKLLLLNSSDDTMIHYCIYHSRYPMAVRSYLESKLDRILKRHNSSLIWDHKEISAVIEKYKQRNHIFVVLASPVSEVGRDHDYDWAIIEPSSMRSIIQIAGRVLRHRNQVPERPNICLLDQNFKSLLGKPLSFINPGFESVLVNLKTHQLSKILPEEYYKVITSIPKIINIKGDQGLIGLEHESLAVQLFGNKKGETSPGKARIWWATKPFWCGEVQRQLRFRKNNEGESYYLVISSDQKSEEWKWKNENKFPPKFCEPLIQIKNIELTDINDSCQFWFNLELKEIYEELAEHFKINLNEVGYKFGEISLNKFNVSATMNDENFYYHPNLGMHQEVKYE